MNLSARFKLVIIQSEYCFTVTIDDECVFYGHQCQEEASYLFTWQDVGWSMCFYCKKTVALAANFVGVGSVFTELGFR
jgi:hypothetical protein